MLSFLTHFKTWWSKYTSQNDLVQSEATLDSLRRFRIMIPIVIVVNIVYTLEFWFHNTGKESALRAQWANAIGWTHFLTGICMLALFLPILRECKREDHHSARATFLQLAFCAVSLAFAIALSVFDQLITTNTTNFAMVSLLIGMTSLMRPVMSIGLFSVTIVAFFALLGFTQSDPDHLNLARSHSMSAVIMTVVASIIVWRQYVIAALLRREIAERNMQLREKTNDIQNMLQNMPQGILTIDGNKRVHPEYSAYLEDIFETRSIADRKVMELVFSSTDLGSDVLSQVEAAIAACVGEDRMNFDFNSHLLVTECDKDMGNGHHKSLELSWSPICGRGDVIEKLMLCVRDVTELKKLTAEAKKQKRELDIIGQILAINQEKFHEFIDSSGKFIVENEQLIKASKTQTGAKPDPDVVAKLFRNMHTIKGNARTYGLLHLTNLVHEAEQTYDALRNAPEASMDHDLLLDQLAQTYAAIEEYARINEVKLGRKGPGRRGSVEKFLMISVAQVQATLSMMNDLDPADNSPASALLKRVRQSIHMYGTDTMADILVGVVGSLPSLAQELGKEPPMIEILDHGIVIKSQISDLVKNVFMHLYRNSMDHGIETPEVRVAAGKPPRGRIALALTLDDERLRLRLKDDGRGLAVGLIRAKAISKGMISSEQTVSSQALAQMILEPGFSTAEKLTEISGRGVGMDAVRSFVEREGGSIEIVFLEPASDQTFRPFETLISLPAKFALQA